jgi:DNA polymerase V
MGDEQTMIALCDMETFYSSVELIFRPDIINRRVVVLSNNDGCIVACTKEAKAIGIQKFAPYFKQKEIIERNDVTVFSSNYALYGAVSMRIMNILSEEAQIVEIYSIDEAFIDVSDISSCLTQFGHKLKDRVWREQKIPMGVGIAPTKTLAKMANKASKHYKKANGVFVLNNNAKWQWLCEKTAIADVWGIGPRLSARLEKEGITNAAQLANMEITQSRRIGGVLLSRTVSELNGIKAITLNTGSTDRQQIISSRSFGEKLNCISTIKAAISTHVFQACRKLQRQNGVARSIRVWIETSAHDNFQTYICPASSWAFDEPVSDQFLISSIAVKMIDQIFVPNRYYTKAGISLTEISSRANWQENLFTKSESSRETQDISKIINQINRKYGGSIVKPARQICSKWEMRRDLISPNYLTKWSDIPSVKCT